MLRVDVDIDRDREARLLGKPVSEFDVVDDISPGCVIYHNNEPKIIFGRFDKQHTAIKNWLPKIKYQNNQRFTRMRHEFEHQRSQDISFGYKPKRPVFGLAASACLFNTEFAEAYAHLKDLGVTMMDLYKRHNETLFNRQSQLMSQIHDRWKIPNTFFTQGIINDTVNLDYHYDQGNIKGCWSCMAVFRRGTRGGNLIIPSMRRRLLIEDETYVLFDGQSLLHGVTPIIKTSQHGRRFSVVYYAIETMKNCGTYEEEIAAMRQIDLRRHKR